MPSLSERSAASMRLRMSHSNSSDLLYDPVVAERRVSRVPPTLDSSVFQPIRSVRVRNGCRTSALSHGMCSFLLNAMDAVQPCMPRHRDRGSVSLFLFHQVNFYSFLSKKRIESHYRRRFFRRRVSRREGRGTSLTRNSSMRAGVALPAFRMRRYNSFA